MHLGLRLAVYMDILQGNTPFSHRCRRRLPSLPFRRASRRFKLSLRSGSLRRKLTVGAFVSPGAVPRILTLGAGAGSSSRAIDSDTVVPRRGDDRGARDGVPGAGPWAGFASEMDKSSSDAAACSVQAEIAIVWCGDRLPCADWGCKFG